MAHCVQDFGMVDVMVMKITLEQKTNVEENAQDISVKVKFH